MVPYNLFDWSMFINLAVELQLSTCDIGYVGNSGVHTV